MRGHGKPRISASHQGVLEIDEPLELARDKRWDLLADLAKLAGVEWKGPIRFHRAELAGVSMTGPPAIAREVTVVFDARISLAALTASLRALWPLLVDSRMVRGTRNRTLGLRKIQLLRHVCLDATALEKTWTDRWQAWNHRRRRGRFADVRGFRTACHDAEEQLTGSRHGLAWFYDPEVRRGHRVDVDDRLREAGFQVQRTRKGGPA